MGHNDQQFSKFLWTSINCKAYIPPDTSHLSPWQLSQTQMKCTHNANISTYIPYGTGYQNVSQFLPKNCMSTCFIEINELKKKNVGGCRMISCLHLTTGPDHLCYAPTQAVSLFLPGAQNCPISARLTNTNIRTTEEAV